MREKSAGYSPALFVFVLLFFFFIFILIVIFFISTIIGINDILNYTVDEVDGNEYDSGFRKVSARSRWLSLKSSRVTSDS